VNPHAPFQPEDLHELGAFLDRADAVVAMEDVYAGRTSRRVIGMRHDCDNVIAPAVAMAQWEAERGYRSTYFILHTAPYWQEKETLRAALELISDCGHEIGFHLNAITAAIQTGGDPVEIADGAANELRDYGHHVHGVVAHGDQACYEHRFVNDELFLESARPDYGDAHRRIGSVRLKPVSRIALGFNYDPNWLPRSQYLSDSGGSWSQQFEQVDYFFPFESGQLHMLVHPDWWGEAFPETRRAAA